MYKKYSKDIFDDIDKSWETILLKDECIDILYKIFKNIDNDLKKINSDYDKKIIYIINLLPW